MADSGSDYEETFETAESGSALVTPTQAGKLKKGDNVMLKGHPCKVLWRRVRGAAFVRAGHDGRAAAFLRWGSPRRRPRCVRFLREAAGAGGLCGVVHGVLA